VRKQRGASAICGARHGPLSPVLARARPSAPAHCARCWSPSQDVAAGSARTDAMPALKCGVIGGHFGSRHRMVVVGVVQNPANAASMVAAQRKDAAGQRQGGANDRANHGTVTPYRSQKRHWETGSKTTTAGSRQMLIPDDTSPRRSPRQSLTFCCPRVGATSGDSSIACHACPQCRVRTEGHGPWSGVRPFSIAVCDSQRGAKVRTTRRPLRGSSWPIRRAPGTGAAGSSAVSITQRSIPCALAPSRPKRGLAMAPFFTQSTVDRRVPAVVQRHPFNAARILCGANYPL
jgi:hypothetical protein